MACVLSVDPERRAGVVGFGGRIVSDSTLASSCPQKLSCLLMAAWL